MVWALSLCVVVAGCSSRPDTTEKPKLNLLLITLDTVRADHLGCYGYASARTPNLDRLATSGVLFEHAFCQAPITLPSHASILTGLQPPRHGVRLNPPERLGGSVVTLAEVLKREGYGTAAFVSAFVVNSQFGLDQGFDLYEDTMTAGGETWMAERPAGETGDLAADWLMGVAKEPFLLWVHFFDAHRPYAPPSPYAEEFAGRPYDGEIAYVDHVVGLVLEALDRSNMAPRTLVVAVGDHGEALGEHGEQTHTLFVYDSTLRVPLIIHPPVGAEAASLGLRSPRPGTRDVRLAEAVDIMPTVLALAGVEPPARLDGVDLFSADRSDEERLAYAESFYPVRFGWSPLRSLRTGDWKFISAPRPELYRWVADAGELEDLAAIEEEAVRGFASLMAEREAVETATSEEVGLRGEEREALASLGYFSGRRGGSATVADVAGLPDPKDHALDFELINLAWEDLHARKYGEAMMKLNQVAGRDPNNAVMHGLLGTVSIHSGSWEAGIKHLRAQAELAPEDAEAAYLLGVGWIRAGSPEAAVEPLRRGVELQPSYAAAWDQLGVALGMAGRVESAVEAGGKAVEWEPENPEYHRNLGVSLLRLGRPRLAAAEFRWALSLRPKDADLAAHLRQAMAQIPSAAQP